MNKNQILIVAEKPSVARDIAKVLKATSAHRGYFEGKTHIVTWAIGHLVTLPEPHQINTKWKTWSFSQLPMLPTHWPLIASAKTIEQYEVVKKLLTECPSVICATDAGREGELIFRYIYELADCQKPVKRLWISSLTTQAIETGLSKLRDAKEFDYLADAARARSRADWLVGMNLSRAYALKSQEPLFVGRVQTPTLAMIVERDLKIRDFIPETYEIIEAQFYAGGDYKATYLGERDQIKKPISTAKEMRFPVKSAQINEVLLRLAKAQCEILSSDAKKTLTPPPLLYDLTELQRNANMVFGFSATRTLELAQSLYEKHKLISYPRTGSQHLSVSVAQTLPDIVMAIREPYHDLIEGFTGTTPLSARFVDDSQVTDHHAIIPTGKPGPHRGLSTEENQIYDLICRRLLSAWQPDHITEVTNLLTICQQLDIFKSTGIVVAQLGWKKLAVTSRERNAAKLLPNGLTPGLNVKLQSAAAVLKKTEAPPHLNDATLLTLMQTAGKNIDDHELARAMKDSGLGTPATRAGIIETLLSRNYVERRARSIVATTLGHRVIEIVHPSVKSPELTGRWEKKLTDIQLGKESLKKFIADLESEITERISEIRNQKFAGAEPLKQEAPRPQPQQSKSFGLAQRSETNVPETRPTAAWAQNTPMRKASLAKDSAQNLLTENSNQGFLAAIPAPIKSTNALLERTQKEIHQKEKTSSENLSLLLKCRFGFETFRQSQERVCQAVVNGQNVLLVMPTGAGKSLCYQLPGIARGGTSLVISPLIALIEDQVAKLKTLGFAAERIHSGRSREDSRNICRSYLQNELDFLFISPERLGVPGFTEFLSRIELSLIAVDEAHCISQWGHDFRPDYRLLGERIKEFGSTPIIAMTATATPIVQNDICKQLNLTKETRFIEGFRRSNIHIQVIEVSSGERIDAIVKILKSKERIPAIVYAPTRKKTEEFKEALAEKFRTGAYHAGMTPEARSRVQTEFLNGGLDVIVATVAFGMGIDKANVRTVVHASLPGSVEGYYQEIGRAGRDGKASNAYLLYSYADQKTHEFFLEMNYPDEGFLQKIFNLLTEDAREKDYIRNQLSSMDLDIFERALEQLWVHRGVIIDPDENMKRGQATWLVNYREQLKQKKVQLQQILYYANGGTNKKCRMQMLVAHFGERIDANLACGCCDICKPESQVSFVTKRALNAKEQNSVKNVFLILSSEKNLAMGRLFEKLSSANPSLSRGLFEKIIAELGRLCQVVIYEDSFEKSGEVIRYRKISLHPAIQNRRQDFDFSFFLSKLEISGQEAKGRPAKKKANSKKATRKKTKVRKKPAHEKALTLATSDSPEFKRIREWRLAQARRLGIPAFRILSDRVLNAICEHQPIDKSDLIEISGVSQKTCDQYGDTILAMLR